MINTIRICEIEDEIRKIETDSDEAEECANMSLNDVEEIYEATQNCLRMYSSEFEACQDDPYLTNLVEERYNLMLKACRECDDFITELETEKKYMKQTCRTNIEALEQEKHMLEVMPQ